MTATLTLRFADGSSKDISLKKVLIINTKNEARQELRFAESSEGWLMTVTQELLRGKTLADDFCSVVKNAG